MLSVVVQAGGGSRRMGQNKALVDFLGQRLVERVIGRMAGIADELLVTARRPEELGFLKVKVVADLLPENGSLEGLYTALSAASYPLVGVVACDMPFASAGLLFAEAELLEQTGADAAVPKTELGLEPLHAVYRRETCLPIVQKALQAGELRMTAWLSQVLVQTLEVSDYHQYDLEGLAFTNVNTPEELHQAKARARSLGE